MPRGISLELSTSGLITDLQRRGGGWGSEEILEIPQLQIIQVGKRRFAAGERDEANFKDAEHAIAGTTSIGLRAEMNGSPPRDESR